MQTATPIAPLAPSTGTRPIPITRESFTEALHLAVVQRGPEYVYERPAGLGFCAYWTPETGPSCLIGLTLWIMGYEEAVREAGCSLIHAGDVLHRLGVVDEWLKSAANIAQGRQDARGTWGLAEAHYLRALEIYPPALS